MSYLNLTRFRYLFENLIKCNLAVRVKGGIEQASYSQEKQQDSPAHQLMKQFRRRQFISSEIRPKGFKELIFLVLI